MMIVNSTLLKPGCRYPLLPTAFAGLRAALLLVELALASRPSPHGWSRWHQNHLQGKKETSVLEAIAN